MISPTTQQEEQIWATEKQECLINHYVSNPELARAKLKKMDNKIKRDSKGRVAKASMEDFKRMEAFRDELNNCRLQGKK